MAPTAPYAQLVHLASWLDATEGENPVVTKQEMRECPSLSKFVQRLYVAVRHMNPALPLTFETFLARATVDDAPTVRTKARRIRWAVRLKEGLRTQAFAVVRASIAGGQASWGGHGRIMDFAGAAV